MSNLTVTIDDDLLRSARVKAVQEGTSVNEVCRRAIAAYASDTGHAQAKAHAKAPASVALLLAGLGGIMFRIRYRTKSG